MNFDFGGSSRKKLSLRGASQNTSREDIVNRARMEREKSLRDKKMSNMATVIQTWFRAQRQKLIIKNKFREEFDSVIRVGKLTKETCATLMKLLMFCYRETIDKNRLVILCRLLTRNFANKDPNAIYMKNIDRNAYQVQLYLLRCAEIIDRLTSTENQTSFESNDVIYTLSAMVSFLDASLFTSTTVYNHICDVVAPALTSVIRKILSSSNTEQTLMPYASILLNRILQSQSSIVGGLVASQILSMQTVFDDILLKSASKSTILNPQVFAAITDGISSEVSIVYPQYQNSNGIPPNLSLIGNLSSIASEISKKSLIPGSYLTAISKLLFENKIMDYIHYNHITTNTKSPKLSQQIEKLFSNVKSVDMNSADFNSMCIVYWVLLGNEEKRTDLINNLAHRSNFISSAWNYLAKNMQSWKENANGAEKLLYLFATSYNSVLSTQDDDEFFSMQKPLTLNNVIELSGQLKDLVFNLYWDGTTDYQLRTELTKLLTNLYNRNSRKRYCPEEHFLLPSTFHIDFTVLTPQYTRTDTENMDIDEEDLVEYHSLQERRIIALQQAMENRSSATTNQREEHRVWNILQEIPFVIPFSKRVKIFQHFVEKDREINGGNWLPPISIRRSRIFEDGYSLLYKLGKELKNDVRVQFISDQGHLEAGIGQGVFKEFIIELSNVAFSANYGLFLFNDEHELYPNPNSHIVNDNDIDHYRFLGLIIGKALYEKILVDIPFARFFLSKLLGKTTLINDLPSLDKSLHKNLTFLKTYEGDVQDLGLTFSIDLDEFGVQKTVNLVPNGSSVTVDNNNKFSYIYRMAYYKLNSQIKKQSAAFVDGLSMIIPKIWLQMFDESELFKLICGTEDVFNTEDMRRNVVYGAPFHDNHPTIEMLWRVVDSFNHDQKRLFLKFITSSPRPPLLGFRDLDQKIGIRPTPIEEGLDKLPTSSTCVNLLKLPAYTSIDQLRDKLLKAIELGSEGFELT